MRGLIFSQVETIADHGPGGLLGDGGFNPILLEQPQLVGHDNRRAVRQGNDANADRGCFWRV